MPPFHYFAIIAMPWLIIFRHYFTPLYFRRLWLLPLDIADAFVHYFILIFRHIQILLMLRR